MAPPAPLQCSVTTCNYETPAGTPNWELMVTLLSTHTQAVHGGGTQQNASSNSKLQQLPRPVFTLNMTESQWSFTKLQWDNYISQLPVSPTVQLMQLQAACDDQLRQRVYDTGVYASLTTTDLFLTKMKELAVVVAQKSFHLTVYEARLTGTADIICVRRRVLTNLSWLKKVSKEAKINELRGKEAEFKF